MQPFQPQPHPLDPNDPELLRLVENQEGRVPYMYLDDRRNVTVGVGQLLATADAAARLPFLFSDRGLGLFAGEAAKRDAWGRVKHARLGTTRAELRRIGGLVLQDAYITILARRRIAEFIAELRRAFSAFDTYPRDAQIALLDIAFNTGSVRPGRWPLLTAAVTRREWREAATQSHRDSRQISGDRNEFTRNRFLAAAVADSVARSQVSPFR